MKQADFIQELALSIDKLDDSEKKEILFDYAEYFRDGKAQGRSESEISAALGTPASIASEILNKSFELSSHEFITDEHSGVSWFKHAWYLFKQAPLMWIIFCLIQFGFNELIEFGPSLKKYSILINEVARIYLGFFIVTIALNLEKTGKFSVINAINDARLNTRRIFLVIFIYLFLLVANQFMVAFIFNHPMTMDLMPNLTTPSETVVSTIVPTVSYLFLFFVTGIVVGSNTSVFSAIKLSCKASIKYFPHLMKLIAVISFWFFLFIALLTAVLLPFNNEISKLLPITSLLMSPFLSVTSLLAYTSWAAVFRDGSMRLHR